MNAQDFLKNSVFSMAMNQAERMLSSRFRIVVLLGQLGKKLSRVENKGNLSAELKEKIFVLGRLLKAYAVGHYRSLPWKAVLSIAAAIIYFVNPADLIPDFIPLSGFIDDFTILIWTYNSLQSELNRFLDWESNSQ